MLTPIFEPSTTMQCYANHLHLSVSCKADLTMLQISFLFLVGFVYEFARCLGTKVNADPFLVDLRIHSSTPDL
jgi:hypothetical protein